MAVDPALPIRAEKAYEWRGYDPAANTASYTPFAEHPHSTGQDYYVSWNNKQAEGYATAGFGLSAVHRADLLDDRVSKLVEEGGVTRASLTRAMADAALTDLRGEQLLPELLKVIRSQPVTDPELNTVVQQLDSWRASGAQRKESSPGSHTYGNADAVRIMDAWWPKLIEAEFKPGLGDDLYGALTANLATDESPAASHGPSGAHSGSAFQYGWWGFADKDLRQVLGQPVKGPLARSYCGNGDLSSCRAALLSTLKQAAAVPWPRCTRPTTAARPVSSGAPTRSSTGRWAGSRRRRSTGRTARRTSRWWSSRRTAEAETAGRAIQARPAGKSSPSGDWGRNR